MPSPASRTSRQQTRGIQPEVLPLFFLPIAMIALRHRMPDWAFMWALALSIFAALKWATWWRARALVPDSTMRSLLYLLAWPGMDAETFLDRGDVPIRPSRPEWFWATSKTVFGIVLLWVVARRVPPQELLLRGWIGLFGLIFFLHFGSFHLISLFWRTVGITAEPIMHKPVRSKSLSEFWGRRWNLGFRQLAHDLIFRPLHRRIGVASSGFLVFLASGLIHDLVISLPAGGGYGLPTAYFTLQGLGVMLERSHAGQRLGLQLGFLGWLFMFGVTI